LERGLHLPVALIIIPLFALANAGISIDFSSISTVIVEPVSLGIIAGLIVGKVVGIFGVAWLAIKLKIAKLPKNSTMSQIFGVVFLGSEAFIFQAKVGILLASLMAGFFGYFWLRFVASKV